MKQKFAIIKDDDQQNILVREYAELDKEMMSLLCEETYPIEALKTAVATGPQAVVNTLRTNNMYPPTVFAQAIAEAVEGLLGEDGNASAELFFDDKELFNLDADQKPIVEEEEEELESDEEVEVDELLEDDYEDDYEDEKVLKDLKSSIKVTEEGNTEIEE